MNKRARNPELPIINPQVVLYNISAEDFDALEKRLAAMKPGKRILGGLTRLLIPFQGLGETDPRRSDIRLLDHYKGQADAKATRLIENPLVSKQLLFSLGVRLDYRSDTRFLHEDGSSQEKSTVIKAFGSNDKEPKPSYFEWVFDVTDGIPESNNLHSLITYRTELSPTPITDPRYEITDMHAYDTDTWQAYGPDDYPDTTLAQINFFNLAGELFGKVETGISLHKPPLTDVKAIGHDRFTND